MKTIPSKPLLREKNKINEVTQVNCNDISNIQKEQKINLNLSSDNIAKFPEIIQKSPIIVKRDAFSNILNFNPLFNKINIIQKKRKKNNVSLCLKRQKNNNLNIMNNGTSNFILDTNNIKDHCQLLNIKLTDFKKVNKLCHPLWSIEKSKASESKQKILHLFFKNFLQKFGRLPNVLYQ